MGFDVRCLNGRLKGSHKFVPDGVCTVLAEDHHYTQIWLAVSSPALRGDWLGKLLVKRGKAQVVMLQPGLNDVSLIGEHVPQKSLTCGLIGLIGFHTPLPGEEGPSGMAWMFPPLSPSLFSGPEAQQIVRSLKLGGCSARKVNDISSTARNGGAVMMPIIGVLSCCHWSFEELSTRTNSRRAVTAVHEALGVVRTGWVSSMLALFVSGWALRLSLRVAPHFLPFNLERMLQSHFTKVGDQTLSIIGEYVVVADDLGMPVPGLRSLHADLDRIEIA